MDAEAFVDGLTTLCLQGHAMFARQLAVERVESEPLVGNLGLAAVAAAMNDGGTLRAATEAARALAPEHPQVIQAVAVMSATLGDPVGALRAARAAAAASPSARTRNGLARLLFAMGQRDEATAILQAVVRDEDDADAHMLLGEQLLGVPGDAALEHFARAYLKAPSDPRPMKAIMGIFRENAWPIGVALLARHVRSATTSPGLTYVTDLVGLAARLYMLGTAWAGLVETSDSVFSEARDAARAVPTAARFTLAGLMIDHDRFDDAKELLRTLGVFATSAPELATHAFLEGRLAASAGEPDLAAARYKAALGHDPRHVDAACNLIDILFRGPPEAFDQIESILMRIPEVTRRLSAFLTYNEAVWREARGETDRALELVHFLLESPLGPLENEVRAQLARLAASSVGQSAAGTTAR